jgi:hypothetical protein
VEILGLIADLVNGELSELDEGLSTRYTSWCRLKRFGFDLVWYLSDADSVGHFDGDTLPLPVAGGATAAESTNCWRQLAIPGS